MRSSYRLNSLRSLLLALGLLFFSSPAVAATTKLAPVDQCASATGFGQFRDRLNAAAKNRDGKALLRLLAADVLINFGGETGRKAFASQWDIHSAASELWFELERILRLGCAKSGDALVMPSLTVQWDPMEDAYDKMIVASSAADLLASPEWGSPPIATLGWDVVTLLESPSDIHSRVRLPDGREGWMSDADLYSPLGYRMVIEKRGGKWMITAFVAGD